MDVFTLTEGVKFYSVNSNGDLVGCVIGLIVIRNLSRQWYVIVAKYNQYVITVDFMCQYLTCEMSGLIPS